MGADEKGEFGKRKRFSSEQFVSFCRMRITDEMDQTQALVLPGLLG